MTIKRRSFLAGLFAAPFVPVKEIAAATAPLNPMIVGWFNVWCKSRARMGIVDPRPYTVPVFTNEEPPPGGWTTMHSRCRWTKEEVTLN